MSRTQIGRDAADAFHSGEPFKRDNTEVRTAGKGARLDLFGNTIARAAHDGSVEVTTAGWETVTTKDRLNAILAPFKVKVFTEGGQLGFWSWETQKSVDWNNSERWINVSEILEMIA